MEEHVHLSVMLLATLAMSMGICDGVQLTAHSSIKIEARWGKSPTEIQKALQEVGSESLLAYSSIKQWVQEFNNGRTTVSNKHLCGRTLSATTDENVECVAKLLNYDRRYTCKEIAHELDISHGSVHCNLTNNLQMWKITAQ